MGCFLERWVLAQFVLVLCVTLVVSIVVMAICQLGASVHTQQLNLCVLKRSGKFQKKQVMDT